MASPASAPPAASRKRATRPGSGRRCLNSGGALLYRDTGAYRYLIEVPLDSGSRGPPARARRAARRRRSASATRSCWQRSRPTSPTRAAASPPPPAPALGPRQYPAPAARANRIADRRHPRRRGPAGAAARREARAPAVVGAGPGVGPRPESRPWSSTGYVRRQVVAGAAWLGRRPRRNRSADFKGRGHRQAVIGGRLTA